MTSTYDCPKCGRQHRNGATGACDRCQRVARNIASGNKCSCCHKPLSTFAVDNAITSHFSCIFDEAYGAA